MKRSKLFLTVMLALLCFVVSGCNNNGNGTSSVPASKQPNSSQASSQKSESKTSNTESQQGDSSSEQTESSQDDNNGMVSGIETDSKDFDAKFSGNPIDKAYKQANLNAASTMEMLEVSRSFSDIWKLEMDFAYHTLLEKSGNDKAKYETEQADWQKSFDSQQQQLLDKANGGGSFAQMEMYNSLRELYRGRANALYRALFNMDKNFAFSYTGQAVG